MNTPDIPSPPGSMSLDDLNRLDEAGFVAHLGGVVEHSPWVAARVWRQRPFVSLATLFQALVDAISACASEEQLALLRVHPELAGQEAVAGTMTRDSHSEQGRLGLLALDTATMARLSDLNRRYRARFGFPFIVALRRHDSLDAVLHSFEQRLAHEPATERAVALREVGEVMRGRLAQAVHESITGQTDPEGRAAHPPTVATHARSSS